MGELIKSQLLFPRVVAIGGGTGLSTMLRGLKKYFKNITAIVTVADDGGGSGALRRDLGILPPGDIRNCILALAEAEPIMKKLFEYRFSEGSLAGQSFGNLFLAAMTGISKDFSQAVQRVGDVLAVSGDVLPVSEANNMNLCAQLSNGERFKGESRIGKTCIDGVHIEQVYLDPPNVKPTKDVIKAIERAELIIMGPGSLYTSIIPNLLVDGVAEAIRDSDAPTIYISNIMMQPAETVGYTVYDHVEAIEKHSYKGIIDCVIANDGDIAHEVLKAYLTDGVDSVLIDYDQFVDKKIELYVDNFVDLKDAITVRHNYEKLAKTIRDIALAKIETRRI